jgi:hypothetical protein
MTQWARRSDYTSVDQTEARSPFLIEGLYD